MAADPPPKKESTSLHYVFLKSHTSYQEHRAPPNEKCFLSYALGTTQVVPEPSCPTTQAACDTKGDTSNSDPFQKKSCCVTSQIVLCLHFAGSPFCQDL